ncbi:MAG: sulfatase-like hydrolase/transferase, partial [Verrucomicrobiota bacterium]
LRSMRTPLRYFLIALSFCCLFSNSSAAEKPNIILIFVDDLGYGDLGCYGNEVIKTPNLDRLAAEGQRWTSFYASGSTCVPSRRGLMSGRHPALLMKEPLIEDREALMPAMLKSLGYQTAMLGKWHLAGYPKDFTTAPMHPLNCGFDSHFGTPGSNDAPGPPKQTLEAFDNATSETWKIPLIRGREVVEDPADQSLFTKRYTEEAVKVIESASQEEAPFFLYLAHNMPHIPIFPSEEFEGVSKGGIYGDVVEEIDWSVGQVVEAVEKAGIAEDTLIVFTSDNGPWTVFGERHAGTAKPLRGEKSTSWEGGFRVPGIFYWPGTIEPAVIEGMGANLDLYRTFGTLAGSDEFPEEKPGWMSVDLTPTLLTGEPSPRNSWLYANDAYRSGPFKIHVATSHPTNPETRKGTPPTKHDTPLLFHLEDDIAEQNDIASQHPEIVERLVSEMEALRKGSN